MRRKPEKMKDMRIPRSINKWLCASLKLEVSGFVFVSKDETKVQVQAAFDFSDFELKLYGEKRLHKINFIARSDGIGNDMA